MDLKFDYIEGIELGLAKEDVDYICHSGSNDVEVAEVTRKDYIKKQLKKYTEKQLMNGISAYITDDLEQIGTRQKKEEYIVWIAAWNIFDER